MMRPGSLLSTAFGIAGFIGFGLWGAFQCHIFWIDHSLNCGWVFIVMAPIGFLAGIAIVGRGFWLIKGLARFSGR